MSVDRQQVKAPPAPLRKTLPQGQLQSPNSVPCHPTVHAPIPVDKCLVRMVKHSLIKRAAFELNLDPPVFAKASVLAGVVRRDCAARPDNLDHSTTPFWPLSGHLKRVKAIGKAQLGPGPF